MAWRNDARRYGAVAMILHWLLAAAILFMIWFGWFIHELPRDHADKFALTQLHKSIGLAILMLSVARLGWRLVNPAPPLAPMPRWETIAARGSHALLYVLMIGTPLIGWAMTSSSPLGLPINWFGLFEWPLLPVLSDMPRETKGEVVRELRELHTWAAYMLLALAGLHVVAALRHHFLLRNDTLRRMIPGTRI